MTASDPPTVERLSSITHRFISSWSDSLTASHRALAALDRQVERQASMMAYRDAFQLLGVVLCSMPLVPFLRRPESGKAVADAELH